MKPLLLKEADDLQDRLWDVARKYYGLDRTDASLERIKLTYTKILSQKLYELGYIHFVETDFEPIDEVLALGFLCSAWPEKVKGTKQALQILAVGSEALGIALVFGLMKEHGKGEAITESIRREILSSLGKKAAFARHSENRTTAERISKWYEANYKKFKSLDKAAEAALAIETVSYRTAYKHIAATAKKLRSARREQ